MQHDCTGAQAPTWETARPSSPEATTVGHQVGQLPQHLSSPRSWCLPPNLPRQATPAAYGLVDTIPPGLDGPGAGSSTGRRRLCYTARNTELSRMGLALCSTKPCGCMYMGQVTARGKKRNDTTCCPHPVKRHAWFVVGILHLVRSVFPFQSVSQSSPPPPLQRSSPASPKAPSPGQDPTPPRKRPSWCRAAGPPPSAPAPCQSP